MCSIRLPKPHDRWRIQINWNTCILLVALSLVIVIIVLIELHTGRVTVHSGFLGYLICLGPERLGGVGFSLLSPLRW